MGKTVPPYYGVEDAVDMVNKIADLDVKINELMIQRETYVEDLKKKLEEVNKAKA